MTTDQSPAKILRAWLLAAELGTDHIAKIEWPVFVSYMPAPSQVSGKEVAVNCLCVYDTQGRPGSRSMRTGKKYMIPGLQVMVRAANEETSYQKAAQIALAMDALYRVEVLVDDNRYLIQNISRTSDPLSLGKEPERDTRRHSVNAVCTVTKLT